MRGGCFEKVWSTPSIRNCFDLSQKGVDGGKGVSYKPHILAGKVDQTNNCVTGTFKNETGWNPIVEFCGILSKQYSYVTLDEFQKKKEMSKNAYDNRSLVDGAAHIRLKGVSLKTSIKDDGAIVCHEDYKRCILDTDFKKITVKHFDICVSSRDDGTPTLYTYTRIKSAVSGVDDKRYVLADGINSLPHGHKDIPRETLEFGI